MFFSSSQKMSWWTTEVGVLKKLVKMKQKKRMFGQLKLLLWSWWTRSDL